MSDNESEKLEEMHQTLTRIAGAVLGDEDAGHIGLVARMNNHAKRIKRLELWVYRIGAASVVVAGIIAGVYRVVTDWVLRK